jgi:hypothetical protein
MHQHSIPYNFNYNVNLQKDFLLYLLGKLEIFVFSPFFVRLYWMRLFLSTRTFLFDVFTYFSPTVNGVIHL